MDQKVSVTNILMELKLKTFNVIRLLNLMLLSIYSWL